MPAAAMTTRDQTFIRSPRRLTGGSDRRPRHGPGGGRFREAPSRVEDPSQAALEDSDLPRAQERRELLGERALLQADECALEVAAEVGRQRLAGEVPDHR